MGGTGKAQKQRRCVAARWSKATGTKLGSNQKTCCRCCCFETQTHALPVQLASHACAQFCGIQEARLGTGHTHTKRRVGFDYWGLICSHNIDHSRPTAPCPCTVPALVLHTQYSLHAQKKGPESMHACVALTPVSPPPPPPPPAQF